VSTPLTPSSQPGAIDLSVIIASYSTASITQACVESVLADTRSATCEVIVVDDASTDDTVERLRREFPQITVLVNEQNVHYSRTNNRGLRAAHGRYAVLLNSDTLMVGDALGTVVRYLDEHPDVGAASPKLLNPDGTVQHSIRSFPGVGVMMAQALNLHKIWPSNPITDRYYHTDFDYEVSQPADSIGTTAFVIRREVWERVGMLDERFKIAFVDLAYCARLGRAGVPIHYVAEASVIHLGSQSINLNSGAEVRARAGYLRLFYDEYLAQRDPRWKRAIVRAGITAWGWLRRLEHRFSKDKRVITGPGAPKRAPQ
jgi:GT2 family glycosyltransferase